MFREMATRMLFYSIKKNNGKKEEKFNLKMKARGGVDEPT